MRILILVLGMTLESVAGHGEPLTDLQAGNPPGELIGRTLAIVGGQAVTLSDVRTASALQLIDANPDVALDDAIARLIDRLLMLREVQRYAPAEPDAAAVDRGVEAVRRRFTSPDALAATLAAGGFTETRLRAWIRDDLRIAAYLDQRFAAVGLPSDEDVASHYASRRAEFEARGQSLNEAASAIREQLFAERRALVIADWVADLRRRTTIVELWKSPPPARDQAVEAGRGERNLCGL
jgi:hypothetical protein